MGLMITKNQKNINFTIVKYRETFYGRYSALTLAAVKLNRFLKRMILESNEHTDKTENS